MEVTYSEWCEGKLRASAAEDAVPNGALHPRLFPFQKQVTEWGLRLGRAAIFAECGLGKTAMQPSGRATSPRTRPPGAHHRAAGRRVADDPRGRSMDLPVEYVRTGGGRRRRGRVVITNYERLDAVPVEAFGGVVLDESSILKSSMGRTKTELCGAARACATGSRAPRRLAPNDHLEPGNHAEFLGLQSHEMIARWFINDTSVRRVPPQGPRDRAVLGLGRVVGSCASRSSDIGHDDDGYVLPALDLPHWVEVDTTQDTGGLLFRSPEMRVQIHKEKRRTVHARAAEVAPSSPPNPGSSGSWCETDYEADV